ncbi:hypothetical protein MM26B8_03740 [Mycoplasmopsis meleagridis]|uniref:Uncharacterized protein n=1 Tax=Mycoplasmopsis meleagridis ATCC 25294 TaxID=1264554 RepID=A0A0F5H203_9BACT|nr:hypothetical protein [Mycoplasmopsis meleagridis]KKB26872.1 hypothetical protein MMELEA_04480 [Mycoplasmopsis meleagridis ATCC 25294]OAD18299.1 hypothetical protein MM26B8_03740 [Mycoplasmopsis meleagridis]VEU77528.1 Uncharacterised protein [Mycoplasmopsis meleagridis]
MRKKNKVFLASSLGFLFLLVGAGVSSAAYFVIKKPATNSIIFKTAKGQLDINISEIEDNLRANVEDFLPIEIDNDYLISDEVKEKITALNNDPNNWIKDEYFSVEDNGKVLVYTDPINHVKFKDFSYGKYHGDYTNNTLNKTNEDEKNRFLLGYHGLALLANHFYNRQTFGPEIANLNSINVDDWRITSNNANGLYLTSTETIYLNGSFVAEKGFTLLQKVRFLVPVLFHEYMHHWASSYVNYANFNDDFVKATYRTHDDPVGTYSYFYKNFYNNFAYYLHFIKKQNDKENKSDLSSEKDNFNYLTNENYIGRIFNTQDLFKLGNTNSQAEYNKLLNMLNELALNSKDKTVTFKKYNTLSNKYINSSFKPSDLSYYYSIVELIPREWVKFALLPYYSAYSSPQQLPHFVANNKGYKVAQNFYLTSYSSLNSEQIVYTNSTYIQDWARAVNDALPVGSSNSESNNTRTFENNIWPYNLEEIDSSSGETIKMPLYKAFYKLFLDSMGFGKVISQIRSKVEWSFVNGNDIKLDSNKNTLDQVNINGYLDSLDYKALILEKDNKMLKVNLKLTPFMKFDVFNKPILSGKATKEDILKPKDIYSNLNNYVAYSTDYFDASLWKNSKIGFWKDTNKNNQIDKGEIIDTFVNDPLPQRNVATSNAKEYYIDNPNITWKQVVSSKDTKTNLYQLTLKDAIII